MADSHTVRRARVPFQKDSAPNRTAEERDRPLTYPEEGQGRNRITEEEGRPSPATRPRIRAPRPERLSLAVLLGVFRFGEGARTVEAG
jgi:hypothetical protein